jgi:hypothetical protein
LKAAPLASPKLVLKFHAKIVVAAADTAAVVVDMVAAADMAAVVAVLLEDVVPLVADSAARVSKKRNESYKKRVENISTLFLCLL